MWILVNSHGLPCTLYINQNSFFRSFLKESSSQERWSERKTFFCESRFLGPVHRPMYHTNTGTLADGHQRSYRMPRFSYQTGAGEMTLNSLMAGHDPAPRSLLFLKRLLCDLHAGQLPAPQAGERQDLLFLRKERIPSLCWKRTLLRIATCWGNLQPGHREFLAYYSYTVFNLWQQAPLSQNKPEPQLIEYADLTNSPESLALTSLRSS